MYISSFHWRYNDGLMNTLNHYSGNRCRFYRPMKHTHSIGVQRRSQRRSPPLILQPGGLMALASSPPQKASSSGSASSSTPAPMIPNPDPFLFSFLSSINRSIQTLHRHYRDSIFPRISASPNIAAICESRYREIRGQLESRLLGELRKFLDITQRWISKTLSKQKSTDFKPKDEHLLYDGQPSIICDGICDFITRIQELAFQGLEGKNLDQFLLIFALRTWDSLVLHIQKQSISLLGAGLLSRDMKEYGAIFKRFQLAQVNEKYSDLRAIAALFFVSVDNLKALIGEGRLAKMEPAFLHGFLKCRVDYSQNRAKILQILSLAE